MSEMMICSEKSLPMKVINEVLKWIDSSRSIAVCTHVHPDPDALGSLLGLTLFLRSIGKNCDAIHPQDIPKEVRFLSGFDILIPEPDTAYDLVIVTDTASRERIGGVSDLPEKAKRTICIDHHKSNTGFFDLNWIDPTASSASEMIFRLTESAGKCRPLGSSEWLYAGLVADSGRFLYNQTSPYSHEMAAILMRQGIDWQRIHLNLFQKMPFGAFAFFRTLLERAEFIHERQIVCSYSLLKDFEEFGVTMDQTDTALNFLRDIEDVELSCMLKETAINTFKVSLRSKSRVDVSQVSKEFGGGGHLRAAGGTVTGSLDEAKQMVITAIREHWMS